MLTNVRKQLLLIFKSLLFLLLFIITSAFAEEYNVPPKPASIAVADIDFDGNLDIVLGHEYYDNWTGISTLINNNTGLFTLVDSTYYGGNHNSLYLIHLDSNNSYDIITEYYDDIGSSGLGTMFDFYNNMYENHYFLNNGSGYLKTGDIDSDDDIDVIFYSNPFFFWGFITNTGLGQYSNPEYYDLDYPPTDVDVGELNGDERDDIVISGQCVEIYFNYESGFDCYQLGDTKLRVRIADVDSDEDNDIIGLSSILGTTWITIYENLGDSNFFEHDQFSFQSNTTQLQISDLNNDNLIDIICSGGYNNGIYVFYNNDNFVFSELQFYFTGEDTRQVHCADLDNNDYNDIIALTHYAVAPEFGKLHILFNDGNDNFVEEPQVAINEECMINNNQYKLSNYPNPFNPQTTIKYSIKELGFVDLNIYDVKGRMIKQLINREMEGGKHNVVWNGKNDNDQYCSSGIYLMELKVNGKVTSTRKLILLK